MGKKIAFFDIDGTLVDEKKDIPSSTKEAIEELKRNDVYVAIATGRPPFLYEDIREELDIQTYISFNGQHVVFEGETIYESPIKAEEINRLFELSLKSDYPMVFMSDSEMRATENHNFQIKKSLDQLGFKYPEIDKDFHLNETIFQALLYCDKKEEEAFKKSCEKFDFIRWHEFCCDVLPFGGSKVVGVNEVLRAAGFSLENSFAFGDGFNDVEMIKTIGTGVAMGNAVTPVKTVADHITDRVDQDGIVNALHYFNLI